MRNAIDPDCLRLSLERVSEGLEATLETPGAAATPGLKVVLPAPKSSGSRLMSTACIHPAPAAPPVIVASDCPSLFRVKLGSRCHRGDRQNVQAQVVTGERRIVDGCQRLRFRLCPFRQRANCRSPLQTHYGNRSGQASNALYCRRRMAVRSGDGLPRMARATVAICAATTSASPGCRLHGSR